VIGRICVGRGISRRSCSGSDEWVGGLDYLTGWVSSSSTLLVSGFCRVGDVLNWIFQGNDCESQV
jgi:hypothetical protein